MKPSIVLIVLLLSLLIAPCLPAADENEGSHSFLAWASRSLHPLATVETTASRSDLAPLRRMIGSAKLVALSEAGHDGAEPLAFRNRMLQYLVEELGFTAIAIESGLTESQVVYDYVLEGAGDLKSVMTRGFSWTFDRYPQNEALVRWLKEYNANPKHQRKVRFYGFDMPGSPGNSMAKRDLRTALAAALNYLKSVDSNAAADFQGRIDPQLQFMHFNPYPRSETETQYSQLSATDRDRLTASIADLISLLERRAATYAAASSDQAYRWAYRHALGARQIDTWLRRIPPNWKLTGAFVRSELLWQLHETRDRAMADNLKWIVEQEGSDGRILIFANRFHLSMVPFTSNILETGLPGYPFGWYLKQEFGTRLVTIGHFVGGGAIGCGFRLDVRPDTSFDGVLSGLTSPMFLLDIRTAPPNVRSWLEREHDIWSPPQNFRVPIARAFDVIFFTRTSTPACAQ